MLACRIRSRSTKICHGRVVTDAVICEACVVRSGQFQTSRMQISVLDHSTTLHSHYICIGIVEAKTGGIAW